MKMLFDRGLLGSRLCKWVSRHRARNRSGQKNPLRAMRGEKKGKSLKGFLNLHAHIRDHRIETEKPIELISLIA